MKLMREEKALFALRELYEGHGYRRFQMSRFEEYDLYVRNKDFLVSDQIITFSDRSGRKPDTTCDEGNIGSVWYPDQLKPAKDRYT